MRSDDNSLLLCLADCLLGCLESLVEYFNKWAYIYVGLYGHGFVEASRNVMALFRNRGWTAIIADALVDTVLAMVCVCVGLITGAIGLIIGVVMQQGEGTLAVAFIVGMVIGFILCSTLFSLISSGVNTVIVCFAEAPDEFQANHPQLAAQMMETWRQAYPNEFAY
jgi:Plasma-membrane choline transporter